MDGFLGVLGGMGPLATADFLRKLVKNTPAEFDQDHIPVMLYGDCTIPDRTANIVGDGPSPLPKLLEGIKFLNDAGAKAICVPCNSAHCWFDDMNAASAVPLFHIVQASSEQVQKKNPGAKKVGVLSTQGTHRMGIYKRTLEGLGYDVETPTQQEFDELVSPAIAMIKANEWMRAEKAYDDAAAHLFERGAEIIILGCTEIPFGMQRAYRTDPTRYVDSNEALADAVIDYFASVQAQI